MPNKIDTDRIVRDRQDKLMNSADQSNAEYVQQLEKSSSLMPPEKPFETEAAQDKVQPDKKKDEARNNNFVQMIKESTFEIERVDESNEVKLHLLNKEYQKVADKLGYEKLSKKDVANLQSILDDVQEKIELYKSKLQAGMMGGGQNAPALDATDEDGNGEEGGIGEAIVDGLKDQVLMAAPGVLLGKKEEEEEEEKEEDGKEYN